MTDAVESVTLRVQRVRRRGATAVAFSGLALDDDGTAMPDAPRYSVKAANRKLPAEVHEGQWWRVHGSFAEVSYTADGWHVTERQIHAMSLELLRPSGEHVVQLLSRSPAFPGVGEVKARRLWEALGDRLYVALDDCDVDVIAKHVGQPLAQVLVEGWAAYGHADTVCAFQKMGLDVSVSQRLLAVYHDEALTLIAADPYRLLAFGMSWAAVDQLARSHFGVGDSDERRFGAAVEAVLHRALEQGHTSMLVDDVHRSLRPLIGSKNSGDAVSRALERHYAVQRGSQLHALGPWAIEQSISCTLATLARSKVRLMQPYAVDALIDQYEVQESLSSGGSIFTLNEAQRAAVHEAASSRLLLITGGAGVGKTTVLKCVRAMLDGAGQHVYQMALAGRAAKRMAEATGKSAMTIAGFLRNVATEPLPENSTIVVDEASMLDVLLAYRLFAVLPVDARLILIGDPAQLPPVGPGLTLHALTDIPEVASVELTVVKRFGGAIAATASAVREGNLPPLPASLEGDVSFIECGVDDVQALVLQLVSRSPLSTQVLTFTKEKGAGSSAALNTACQRALAGESKRLLVFNDDKARLEDSGFRLDEPVLCTKNLWNVGVQNGSLGRIHAIEEIPLVDLQGVVTYGWIRWDDDEIRPITGEVLDAIELGYAITVHKAQGSQFDVVVVAVFAARNLDRTMLYTALTRAKRRVVLVGDRVAAERVVADLPSSSRRNVALRGLLCERLAEG